MRWRPAVTEIGREKLHVRDLRHTYAALPRRAEPTFTCFKGRWATLGSPERAYHADLFDEELDEIAAALEIRANPARATVWSHGRVGAEEIRWARVID